MVTSARRWSPATWAVPPDRWSRTSSTRSVSRLPARPVAAGTRPRCPSPLPARNFLCKPSRQRTRWCRALTSRWRAKSASRAPSTGPCAPFGWRARLAVEISLVTFNSSTPSIAGEFRWFSAAASGHLDQSLFALADGERRVDSTVKLYAAVLTIGNASDQHLGLYACRIEAANSTISPAEAEMSLDPAPSVVDQLPDRPFDLNQCCRAGTSCCATANKGAENGWRHICVSCWAAKDWWALDANFQKTNKRVANKWIDSPSKFEFFL